MENLLLLGVPILKNITVITCIIKEMFFPCMVVSADLSLNSAGDENLVDGSQFCLPTI